MMHKEQNSTFSLFVKKNLKNDYPQLRGNMIIAGGYISFLYRQFFVYKKSFNYLGDVDVFGEFSDSKIKKVNYSYYKIKEDRFSLLNEFDINSVMIGYDCLTETIFYNDHFLQYIESNEIKIINKNVGDEIRHIIRAWMKEFREEGKYLDFEKDIENIKEASLVFPVISIKEKWDMFKRYNDCFKESYDYIIKK